MWHPSEFSKTSLISNLIPVTRYDDRLHREKNAESNNTEANLELVLRIHLYDICGHED